ncbi:hypothetical protein MAPG_07402 [Magnaporthiopsis poae ATCC 64411]|uniref:Nephrocystin 3-like N-terminal domain-containing protein n=1 Tax=Magnaporthiopsis poae (strain ATCC 64411 / 73-15) TaxID=644358 RepID=A0A0C4E4K6_MAGP6|nr:hypothetical protein MAPG_07402 [Magnaporthiopsis poae ATCC 64411]
MASRSIADSPSGMPAEGLTVLRVPETDASADIVFVHGFTGHPYRTWLKQGAQISGGAGEPPQKSRKLHLFSKPHDTHSVYWPTDLLPETAPGARIMTYGYDTHVRNKFIGPPPSHNTVYDIAGDLLVAIEAERRASPDRPLLFVAHSLGGIVVKEMLRRSQGCAWQDHLRHVGSSTIGVVFFGTPHSGSDPRNALLRVAESLIRGLGWTVNQAVVDCLLPSAERLRELRDEFPVIAQRKHWAIHSFQEQHGVRFLGGKKVVDDASSCLNYPIEVTQHIASDHMDMCRFSGPTDPEYRKVASALQRILPSSHRPVTVPEPKPLGDFDTQICREWFSSLAFDQMGDRHMIIKRAHRKTCKWFLTQPEYMDWQDESKAAENNGVLWIKGNPGTGKSTLMKYLLERAKNGLRANRVVSFFFNARGDDLEKSTAGMYRHLLYQILQKATDDDALAIQKRFIEESDLEDATAPRWTVDLLEDLFRAAVLVPRHRVTCFVDALDECNENEIRDMIAFFSELGEKSTTRGFPFQVCFSSRHYPHITIDKCLELKLEGQVGHERDIVSYLESELKIGKSNTAQKVRSEMLRKASGIFMWVVLVTQILNKEFDDGYSHALETKLNDIPTDLHELFESILTRDDNKKDQLLLCIQWTLFARRPLSPEELYFAMLSDPRSGKFSVSRQPWDSNEITRDVMKKFILSSSKGLAEVTSTKKPTVQFIHESVRDYLLRDGGLGNLWPGLGGNFTPISHDVLKTGCLNYIQEGNFEEIPAAARDTSASHPPWWDTPPEDDCDWREWEMETERRQRLLSTFPFLRYALQNVMHHADCAQQGDVSQVQFLDDFPRTKWIKLDNAIAQYRSRWHTAKATLLYLLAEQNASSLIRVYPSRVSFYDDAETATERYGVPLVAGIAHGAHEAIAQLLASEISLSGPDGNEFLTANSMPNESAKGRQNLQLKWTPGRSLCWYLLRYGHIPFVKLFVSAINSETRLSEDHICDVLKTAADEGDENMIEALLSGQLHRTAAGPAAYRSALQQYFYGGHTRQFEVLLRHRAGDLDLTGSWLLQPRIHELPPDDDLAIMVNMLDDAGYGFDAAHESKLTLLDQVVWHGCDASSAAILQAGAKVNIWAAAGLGRIGDIASLLDDGADINIPDVNGRVALMYAARNSCEDLVRFLLTHGANAKHVSDSWVTVLHALAGSGRRVTEAVVDLLVEYGAEVDPMDSAGWTPLMSVLYAAGAPSIDIVAVLLRNGVRVDTKDRHGETPLHYLAQNKAFCLENMRLLREKGAEVDARDRSGQSPLHHAMTPECVEALCSYGADIELRNNQGYTPLLHACLMKRHPGVIACLIRRGASKDARTKHGSTVNGLMLSAKRQWVAQYPDAYHQLEQLLRQD